MASWHDVRRIALAFPGAREHVSSHGHRTWTINDKFFAWERPLRASDRKALGNKAPAGPILAVRTDGLEMKEALLASNPRAYFTTPHFVGYSAVLVRLERIRVKELRDLLDEAWLARAPKRMIAAYLQARKRA